MRAIQRITVALYISTALLAANSASSEKEDKKVARGLQIAPVAIKTDNTNKDRVGMGSYLVNAAAGCATVTPVQPLLPGTVKAKASKSMQRTTWRVECRL